MLSQNLINAKHGEKKPLKPYKSRKGICYRVFYKMQFIKYRTGMRIFSQDTESEYRMMNWYGILLLIISIFTFVFFIVESSLQVGYLKSTVFTMTQPLERLLIPIKNSTILSNFQIQFQESLSEELLCSGTKIYFFNYYYLQKEKGKTGYYFSKIPYDC